ncbi:hypothetical protein D3C75_1263480 [compost metagenome]
MEKLGRDHIFGKPLPYRILQLVLWNRLSSGIETDNFVGFPILHSRYSNLLQTGQLL